MGVNWSQEIPHDFNARCFQSLSDSSFWWPSLPSPLVQAGWHPAHSCLSRNLPSPNSLSKLAGILRATKPADRCCEAIKVNFSIQTCWNTWYLLIIDTGMVWFHWRNVTWFIRPMLDLFQTCPPPHQGQELHQHWQPWLLPFVPAPANRNDGNSENRKKNV